MANLLNPAGVVDAYRGGVLFGQQQREQKRLDSEREQLRSLTPGILQGDPAAFSQGAAIDRKAATELQSAGDQQYRRLMNVSKMMRQAINTGNPQAKARAFQTIRPFLAQMTEGRPVPEQWDDSLLQGFEQFENRISMAASPQGQQRNLAVSPGSAIVDPATGQVIYERPFAPAKPIWDSARGVFINPPGAGDPAAAPADGPTRPDMEADIALANELVASGVAPEAVDKFLESRGQRAQQMAAQGLGGPQAIPVQGVTPKPEISAVEQERLRLAQEASRRADEASQRAADAARRAERGTAPAGQRFRADGSLEDIPGAKAGAQSMDQQKAQFAYRAMAEDAVGFAAAFLGVPVEEVRQMTPEQVREGIKRGRLSSGPVVGSLPFADKVLNPDLAAYSGAAAGKQARVNNPTGPVTDADFKVAAKSVFSPDKPADVNADLVFTTLKRARDLDSPAPAGPAVREPSGTQAPIRVQNAQDYQAVPSGATYIAPDGTTRRKP